MGTVSLNDKYLNQFIEKDEVIAVQDFVKAAHRKIHEKSGAGAEYLGWLDWATQLDKDEVSRIEETAQKLCREAEVLIVIGIGGSYLGAKAVQDLLCPSFGLNKMEVIYAGQNLSGRYMEELLSFIEGKEVALNVISKSGTTTEPAIAFRVLRAWMYEKYGEQAAERIIVTTDKTEGALRKAADATGYTSFEIPPDIGGRYSVLTAVGLLPLAVAGVDIRALVDGAAQAEKDLASEDLFENAAYLYAAYRQILNARGYSIEVLASFEPAMSGINEWWKQLFGESEGKQGKGIFPASVIYSTDLHSLGQYLQNGRRTLFETMISFKEEQYQSRIPFDQENGDGLNYLADKTLHEVNQQAMNATALAHVEGGVPVVTIEVERVDAFHTGYLIYFFLKACAMSAYLSGVNPFDQPGVELYKQNMFELLGKPGYEKKI
ncbi:glucose-6-phosphate isomerase [Planococcus shenhongbingii]|uniref:glucose-6-phosphate isomerase n=1 Tax=Planococcus shenhongbingii TaxID=3058398 RepID=UPI00262F99A6|nr:glucose-6-phosphate isomerase [Planococcus sp. N016]WKA60497.1 glucose-6-phosphate isomerase [Planococcus sp. N016]